MIDLLTSLISDHSKVLILGYGKEGRSTYGFLRKHFPELLLGIADLNSEIANNAELLNDHNLEIITGSNYLDSFKNFEIIIKSPGVNIGNISSELLKRITSQTDLFLQCYAQQVVGVTGTKGKSTTASLIRHFIDADNKKALLLGNIGVPAFDMIDAIENDTIIVYELSAHQLEYLSSSPHIAVLLNVFPEHLDYFNSFSDYRKAKFNICKFQNEDDCLIVHESLIGEFQETGIKSQEPGNKTFQRPQVLEESLDEPGTRNQEPGTRNQEPGTRNQEPGTRNQEPGTRNQEPGNRNQDKKQKIIGIFDKDTKLKIENPPLVGDHNLVNIKAALYAAVEAGVNIEVALNSLKKFKNLPHRLEYVGEFGGIRFVNDSISTVPESTIAAVKALNNVDTLILGGYDRGLDYTGLVEFLKTSCVNNFIFIGKAGDRMYDIFKTNNNLFKADSIESAFEIIVKTTAKGSICLLSPAAASYDQFHNFEHRGDTFKALAVKL